MPRLHHPSRRRQPRPLGQPESGRQPGGCHGKRGGELPPAGSRPGADHRPRRIEPADPHRQRPHCDGGGLGQGAVAPPGLHRCGRHGDQRAPHAAGGVRGGLQRDFTPRPGPRRRRRLPRRVAGHRRRHRRQGGGDHGPAVRHPPRRRARRHRPLHRPMLL